MYLKPASIEHVSFNLKNMVGIVSNIILAGRHKLWKINIFGEFLRHRHDVSQKVVFCNNFWPLSPWILRGQYFSQEIWSKIRKSNQTLSRESSAGFAFLLLGKWKENLQRDQFSLLSTQPFTRNCDHFGQQHGVLNERPTCSRVVWLIEYSSPSPTSALTWNLDCNFLAKRVHTDPNNR